MYRYSIVILVLLASFFGGCSIKSVKPQDTSVKQYKYEDKYTLFALMYNQEGQYEKALKYYEILYKNTKKKEYLKEILMLSIRLQDYDTLGKYSKVALKDFPNDDFFKRVQIQYYIFKKDFKEASRLSIELTNRYKTEKNYEFAGYAFLTMKKYSLALKYFERA
ncbi:MAG: hypothetical protein GXO12_06555, partial [Epsilonproteobacteria bacterium]|nr:hypothetical protein [Campylobacterota bacterium]